MWFHQQLACIHSDRNIRMTRRCCYSCGRNVQGGTHLHLQINYGKAVGNTVDVTFIQMTRNNRNIFYVFQREINILNV